MGEHRWTQRDSEWMQRLSELFQTLERAGIHTQGQLNDRLAELSALQERNRGLEGAVQQGDAMYRELRKQHELACEQLAQLRGELQEALQIAGDARETSVVAAMENMRQKTCRLDDENQKLTEDLQAREREVETLKAKLNTPELHDFVQAVVTEAAHQRERWGVDHDAGKTAEDWLWLLSYLATKATQASRYGDTDKYLHHIITAAAACANWHANASGINTSMRPGVDPAKYVKAERKEKG